MAQRQSKAVLETKKKISMDPTTGKKHPSTTTLLIKPDHHQLKIKPQFPKGNPTYRTTPSFALKSPQVDPPRIDTHLQVKSLTLSANADSFLFKKTLHQKPSKQITKTPEVMEKKKTNREEKVKISKPRKAVAVVVAEEVSVGSLTGGDVGRRRSFCDSRIELSEFFSRVGARIAAVDMPPFMQIHAVSCARKVYDGAEKLSSKTLASTLKKEFDGVYGPAWHCIVGSSFGSFVTHSVGGFLYFSMDHKLYILLFKTTVQRADD